MVNSESEKAKPKEPETKAHEVRNRHQPEGGHTVADDDDMRIKDIVREILSERGIIPETAKEDVVAEAVDATQTEEEKKLVAEAVGSASTLEAKKAAAATAVITALDNQKEEIVTEAMQSLRPEARMDVAAEAMKAVAETKEDTVLAIVLAPKANRVVEELMHRNGRERSFSRVLAEALAFEKWYRDVIAAGGRVLVERSRGDYREVKRP
jgi:hypothetical protein